VHAFDLASRPWRRISDGYVLGGAREYGAGARYPASVRRFRHTPTTMFSTTRWETTT